MPFDPQTQLRIELDATGGLRSTGLAAVGRPELCLLGAPLELAREGAGVINILAEYVAEHPVADGERVSTPHEAGAVVVRLVRESAGTQRIVDAWDPDDGVPWIALTTILCWRAHDLVGQGRVPEACAVLEGSLRWSPIPRQSPPWLALPYNHGGSNAARYLARLDAPQRERWLAEAARRNPMLAPLPDTIEGMVALLAEGAPLTEPRPDPKLGPQYSQRGMYGEALFCANYLLTSAPDHGIAWRLRGEALFGLRRFREAALAFDRTAELGGPAARGTLVWRARCLTEVGDHAGLARLVRGFLAAPPSWADASDVGVAEALADRL